MRSAVRYRCRTGNIIVMLLGVMGLGLWTMPGKSAVSEETTAMQALVGQMRQHDWRAYELGDLVYGGDNQVSLPAGFHYREGLSTFQLSATVWLRMITVARKSEGDSTQHIMAQRSTDGGHTWGTWFPLEPEGPPISSYGGFTRHPTTGRVYYIYIYGPDEHQPPLADGAAFQGHPHHIGRAAMRYVEPDGTFSARYFLNLPHTAIDDTNAFKGRFQALYAVPRPVMLMGNDGLGWYTKLGPRIDVGQGEAFLVRFVGYANNDRLHELPIVLQPVGDHGIQAPGSTSVAEFGPMLLTERNYYFKFRTTAGFVGSAESHDAGQTMQAGFLRYGPGQRYVKNPEGPLNATSDGQGRRFLTFYNNSEAKPRFGGRDLVWISYYRERAHGGLDVTEPELLLYRQDGEGISPNQDTRLNCPGFRTAPAGVISTTSTKLDSRTCIIPTAFLDLIAGQFERQSIPEDGLLLSARKPSATCVLPPQPLLATGNGLTIACTVDAGTTGMLLSAWEENRGLRVELIPNATVRVTLADGTHTLTLDADAGALQAPGPHRIAVIIDGHARLIAMVVDGHVQDGGATRGRGTIRIPPTFSNLILPSTCRIGPSGTPRDLRIYSRALFFTEVIGLQRATAAGAP